MRFHEGERFPVKREEHAKANRIRASVPFRVARTADEGGRTGPAMNVELYSDGSSRGNPGPGGYGTLLRYTAPSGNVHEREISQGYAQTTNNRMELMGAIAGFEALNRPCHVEFYSDSQYVVKAFTDDWISGWLRRGWKNSQKQPVKNVDLWKRLIAAVEPHDVEFHWVRGHAGHPENERCDELATTAADGDDLMADEGYEEE